MLLFLNVSRFEQTFSKILMIMDSIKPKIENKIITPLQSSKYVKHLNKVLMSIDLSKLYKKSWYLWFGQNLCIFLCAFWYIGTYFSLILFYMTSDYFLEVVFSLLLRGTLYIALFLDLVAIGIISLVAILAGYHAFKRSHSLIIPSLISISGLMWIITSFLWRIPFYLEGPIRFEAVPLSLLTNYIHESDKNILFFVLFIAGSFFLFSFLALQDIYFTLPGRIPYKRAVYGLVVLIGNFVIVWYAFFREVLLLDHINLTFFYWILMVVWKLIVTSLVGMAIAEQVFSHKEYLICDK